MAINIIQGFNPSTTEPIDSRSLVANQTARFAIPNYNAYNGLLVFQQSDSTLWQLINIANITIAGGWSQVGAGGEVPFQATNVASGSSAVLFTIDPTTCTSISINYYLEYSASARENPNRSGNIQAVIPYNYSAEPVYFTEQSTERPSSYDADKGGPSTNTETAYFTFELISSPSYAFEFKINNDYLVSNNPDDDPLSVNVKGKYKILEAF
jgi:hypothetical protein